MERRDGVMMREASGFERLASRFRRMRIDSDPSALVPDWCQTHKNERARTFLPSPLIGRRPSEVDSGLFRTEDILPFLYEPHV